MISKHNQHKFPYNFLQTTLQKNSQISPYVNGTSNFQTFFLYSLFWHSQLSNFCVKKMSNPYLCQHLPFSIY
jgi:hypothetical protein